MKANGVPDKIYLNPLLMEDGESIVRRCTFERQRDSQVEYAQTEAFVEKAQLFFIDKLKEIPMGYDNKRLRQIILLRNLLKCLKTIWKESNGMKCPHCGGELKETKGVTYDGKHSYYCIVCGYKGWLYKQG